MGVRYASFEGKGNYDYTNPYSGTETKYSSTAMTGHFTSEFLGLRIPLLSFSPLHPFIQGGGEIGSAQLSYTKLSKDHPTMTDPTSETRLFAGAFGEGGMELVLFNKLMIAASARYTKINTGKFLTLGDQTMLATGMSYMGTIGARF
jgi:hypothetical protein